MRRECPWLWKVESRRLLWLLGLTFALVVTFQYIELPYAISSIFSSTKIPISRNSTSLIGNSTSAMAPSFSQSETDPGGDDEEVEVDQIFDSNGNVTAPAISPTTATLPPLKENATAPAANAGAPAALPGLNPSPVKENATTPAPTPSAKPPAALPGLNPSLVKENATTPAPSAEAPAALPDLNPYPVKENATAPAAVAKAPAALPGRNPSPVKENATLPTTSQVQERNSSKTDVGDASLVVRFVPDVKENAKMPDSGVMSISEMSKQLRQNRISHNRLAKVHHDLDILHSYLRSNNSVTCFIF